MRFSYRAVLRFFVLFPVIVGSFFNSGAAAQNTYGLKRGELDFHVGPAIPLGAFGKSAFQNVDISAGTLGYHGAKVGVNYGLSFAYYIHPDVGIMILFNGHSNALRAEGFSAYHPDWEWTTDEKDKWTEFMAMAGVTYRVQLLDWMVLAFRGYLGYGHLVSPFYRATVTRSSTVYTYQVGSDKSHSFGYGAGAALKFLITKGFHIDLRCEYMGAVPYKFLSTGEARMPNPFGGDATVLDSREFFFRENFQMMNVSAGFTVGF